MATFTITPSEFGDPFTVSAADADSAALLACQTQPLVLAPRMNRFTANLTGSVDGTTYQAYCVDQPPQLSNPRGQLFTCV